MEKLKGLLYLTCAFTLAGTSVIAARFVAPHLGTFTIAGASLFFAILGLLPVCVGKLGKVLPRLSQRDWLALLLQATFGIFLFRMFLLQGLARTSAGEAGILTGATPAATAILAILVLKEPLKLKSMVGIGGTVLGIAILQGLLQPGSRFSIEHSLGNILVLCAALCESLFNVLSRVSSLRGRTGSNQTVDPITQTLIVAGIAFGLCLIPASFERPVSTLASLRMDGWLALAWYGLVVTALAFICWYAGIRRCRASTAAAISGLMPFTALVLSVLLLGEHAGWQQWAGGSLIVLGIVLIGLDSSTAGKQPERIRHSNPNIPSAIIKLEYETPHLELRRRFPQKDGAARKLNPDLAVIQECERPEKLLFPLDFRPASMAWCGDAGAAKGVGVFGFSGLRVEVAADVYDPTIRYCLPLRVTGAWNFHLIAIWAMPSRNPREWSYVGQVCRALETYAVFIHAEDTLLAGDFNSNLIFDRRGRACNHSTVVEKLAQNGIVSLYHEYFHESHGQESHPTFYLTKKITRPFHLDYCFAPTAWSQRVSRLAVGDFAEWRPWSDHCPVFVEVDM